MSRYILYPSDHLLFILIVNVYFQKGKTVICSLNGYINFLYIHPVIWMHTPCYNFREKILLFLHLNIRVARVTREKCVCGDLIVQQTVWTQVNLERRFTVCGEHKCNLLFRWVEESVCARSQVIISGFLRKINNLNDFLKRDLRFCFMFYLLIVIYAPHLRKVNNQIRGKIVRGRDVKCNGRESFEM